MTVALALLSALLVAALAAQTVRLRTARSLLPPSEWRIGGVVLPSPDDPTWRERNGALVILDRETGRPAVKVENKQGDSWVSVGDITIGGYFESRAETARYARAVAAAYANRKALEAITS